MLIQDEEVRRWDVPGYFSDEFWAALQIWQRYHWYGWALAGGWAQQPALHLDIIETLDAENRKRGKKAIAIGNA